MYVSYYIKIPKRTKAPIQENKFWHKGPLDTDQDVDADKKNLKT